MMHPGIVGALALIGTAGAIYFGSGYLSDYFAARNADTAVQTEEATGTPSSLVADVAETPADDAAEVETSDVESPAEEAIETAEEAVETVAEEVAALVEETAEAAEEAVTAVQETAQETLERVLETSSRDETETSQQETTPEPGTTPVLDIVRIEPTGEAVIAGNAPEGERVGLIYNNELIADTEVDAGGDFVLVPDEPIPSGEGTMEVAVLDEEGNAVLPSQEQVAVVLPEDGSDEGFLVGVLRPDEPVDIIERQAPEVETAIRVEPASEETETSITEDAAQTSESESEATEAETPEVEVAARIEPTQPVDVDEPATAEPFVVVDAIELEGREMWIAGGALPGTVVRLYQDNEFLGEVVTGEEGRYLYEGTLLDSEGEVTVRADALAPGSADVIARAQVPFEVPLSVAELATAALEQVEETVTVVEEEVADAADAVTEAVETAQEQVAEVTETVSEVADAAQEQVESAVEIASDAASVANEATEQVADTTDEPAVTPEIEAETDIAQAAETIAEVAEAVEGAVVEAGAEETADASGSDAPQVEIAATTTPQTSASSPPTEELAQALAEAAAETSEQTQPTASEVAATDDGAEAAPASVGSETSAPASASEVASDDSTEVEVAASTPASETRPERISVLDTGQVIIRRGDNLWRLSRRVYGQGIRYTSIYDANRDQIGRPELIFPGQVFTLPTPQEEWGEVPGLDALEPDQIPGSSD